MKRKKNVGIFVFDAVEILDFAGPYEVFSSARLIKESKSNIYDFPNPFEVFTISEKRKNIKANGNLLIKSNYTFEDAPKLNVLIIPGGIGTRKLIKNKNVINWINTNKNIEILASVCTGALLLGKAGLLIDKKATTHWGALELLKVITPSTKIIKNKKFVFDTYYTSAGVSSGIAMSLNIVEFFLGKIVAKNTAKFMEYNY